MWRIQHESNISEKFIKFLQKKRNDFSTSTYIFIYYFQFHQPTLSRLYIFQCIKFLSFVYSVLTTVTIESENKGLQLKAKKAECMVISKHLDIPVCVNSLQSGKNESSKDLYILGLPITPDARCDTEIKKRIALSKDTFTKIESIFTNRNIRICTKTNTLKAYMWSILLHGCEY